MQAREVIEIFAWTKRVFCIIDLIHDPGRSEPAAVAVHILFLFEPFVFSLVLSRGALVFSIAMLFCLELTKDVETSPFNICLTIIIRNHVDSK